MSPGRVLPSRDVRDWISAPSSLVRRSLAAACALTCGVAVAQERGRLIEVRAGGDAAESFIELVGDRPLSFTTLKLRSPARVIVDFADTDLALAERDLPVDDGTIRRVAAAPAGQKTARVVIELLADAEFAVRAHGSTIEVRVPRIAPLLSQVEREPTGQGAQPLPPAAGSPGTRTQVASGQPPSTDPKAAATGPSPQLAQSPEVAPRAAVGDDASERAAEVGRPVEAPVRAAGSGPREVAAAGQAGAPDEARAAPSAAEARPSAPAGAAAAESQKRASLPTVALVGSRQSPPPPESAAARKRREKEGRVAAYAAAQRAAAEQSAAARERRLGAGAGQRSAAEPATAAQQARTAPGVEQRRAAPDHQRNLAAAAPHHSITGIGFRPVGDGEVIVRSDQPLEYGVTAEGNAVVLHLPGAGIALPNNRRPLDTRFFGGPVQRVVPLAVASGTDLRIEVRGHADYQLAQAGGVLTVTFSAPR